MSNISDNDIAQWNQESLSTLLEGVGANGVEEFNKEVAEDLKIITDTVTEISDLMKRGLTPAGSYALAMSTLMDVDEIRLMQAFCALLVHEATEQYIKESTGGISSSE